MNKKTLAKEYLRLIKYIGIGLVTWSCFLVLMLLVGQLSADDFWTIFLLPIGSPGDAYVGAAEILMSWLVILAPYLILSITRSIIWAKKQTKDA